MNEKRSDSGSKSRQEPNNHAVVSNGAHGSSEQEQEDEEEEDESFASGRVDDDVEATDVPSEEQSRAESIPDSFHTPSASIQNLNSSANLAHHLKSVNNSSITNVEKAARSSTRSNASSSSGNSAKCGSESGHKRSGSNGSGNSNKSDSEQFKKESPKRSGSGASSKNKDSDSVKGSPEGCRRDVTTGIISTVESTTPPQTSVVLEVTQSLESKESSLCSSGGSSIASGSIREHHHQHPMIIGTPARFNPKPNKKKMWYHVFYPSYKTRSSDFKRIFKDLPAEERLIVGKNSFKISVKIEKTGVTSGLLP